MWASSAGDSWNSSSLVPNQIGVGQMYCSTNIGTFIILKLERGGFIVGGKGVCIKLSELGKAKM